MARLSKENDTKRGNCRAPSLPDPPVMAELHGTAQSNRPVPSGPTYVPWDTIAAWPCEEPPPLEELLRAYDEPPCEVADRAACTPNDCRCVHGYHCDPVP